MTYVCHDGAFKDDDVSSGTKTPKQVSYYVDSPSGEMTRDESFDIANEVRQSYAVEERLFSLCHAEGKALYQQQKYIQKKSEDCAWTPVIDEELLKFLESADEHKPGWSPYQNGHDQVNYRAKALRTPDPYYSSKQYYFRTSIVKKKCVWWLLEMNVDVRKVKNQTALKEEAETLVSIFLPAERTCLVKTMHERCGPFSLVALSHEVHTVSVLKDFLSLKQCKNATQLKQLKSTSRDFP